MGGYTYSSIIVTTRHGEFKTMYCDYYIQDGILTVFRSKEKTTGSPNYGDYRKYPVCEKHYPMERVVEIECIK